jgi:phospholipid transport system substrate-binding protein
MTGKLCLRTKLKIQISRFGNQEINRSRSMLTENDVRDVWKKVLILLVLSLPSLALAADGPMEIIKSGTQQVLNIIGCHNGEHIQVKRHRQEILKIVDEYFDFREMSRRALGRPWKGLTPDKQDSFASLFRDLLFNTYVDKVETYTCSDENVSYDGQQVEGDYALVRTTVASANKDVSAKVDYRLHLENGEWKVYDVVVEGISLVNNYREQFNSILANKSFDELLKLLREKVAAY